MPHGGRHILRFALLGFFRRLQNRECLSISVGRLVQKLVTLDVLEKQVSAPPKAVCRVWGRIRVSSRCCCTGTYSSISFAKRTRSMGRRAKLPFATRPVVCMRVCVWHVNVGSHTNVKLRVDNLVPDRAQTRDFLRAPLDLQPRAKQARLSPDCRPVARVVCGGHTQCARPGQHFGCVSVLLRV